MFTPATRRYLENVARSGDSLRPGSKEFNQFQSEIRGILADWILLSETPNNNLTFGELALPADLNLKDDHSLISGTPASMSQADAERIIGFLHLVRVIKQSAPEQDLDQLLDYLDIAEANFQLEREEIEDF